MRPIWSGSISFGLVSVPVRMYSASEPKELRFNEEAVDLMAALRESVERTQKQKKKAKRSAKKAS